MKVLKILWKIVTIVFIIIFIIEMYNQVNLRRSDNKVSCGGENFVYKEYEDQLALIRSSMWHRVYIERYCIYTKVGDFRYKTDLPEEKPDIDYICHNSKYKIFRINNDYFIVYVKSKRTVLLSDYIYENANYNKLRQCKSIIKKFYKYLQNRKDNNYGNKIYNEEYIEICEEVLNFKERK